MPIYEYRCSECGERFSRMRPLREVEEPARCPRCGNEKARRVISLVADARKCGPAG